MLFATSVWEKLKLKIKLRLQLIQEGNESVANDLKIRDDVSPFFLSYFSAHRSEIGIRVVPADGEYFIHDLCCT